MSHIMKLTVRHWHTYRPWIMNHDINNIYHVLDFIYYNVTHFISVSSHFIIVRDNTHDDLQATHYITLSIALY